MSGSPRRSTCRATSGTSSAPPGAAASAEGADGALRWASNITALEGVQPADLGPEEIRAKLGAPWIPPGDVRAFAAETLGYAPEVSYLPVTAQWEVKAERGFADTAAATEEWGTGRIDGYRLLELAVNGRVPVIYDTVATPDGETRVRNQAETMLAEEKQRALAARFAEWAWEDPERADRLCAEYNQRFNSVVLRRYDGTHLTFPGMDDRVHAVPAPAGHGAPDHLLTGQPVPVPGGDRQDADHVHGRPQAPGTRPGQPSR